MRRYQLFFIGSAFAISGAIGACSGDTTPGDGGGPETGPSDAKADKQPLPDAAGDAAPPVTPAGTQLAASDQIQIFGITTDDDVIYADGSSPGLYAVPSGRRNADENRLRLRRTSLASPARSFSFGRASTRRRASARFRFGRTAARSLRFPTRALRRPRCSALRRMARTSSSRRAPRTTPPTSSARTATARAKRRS